MVVQDKPNYRDISQGESGSTDRKQRLRERFEVVKKLGQGTYGKVQLAVNKETKQEVAIKTIKKAKIENEQDLVRIRREIQIMSSIHHPHIIHIYEVFENQEKIVLIMQYASGGELYDYLGCRKKLEEKEARRVFRQVASAIFYCHKNRICHRDLKLENILLDDRGNAKIADFGLSNVFDERFKLKTFCGSPLYASPEIVRGNPYCGPEVDCWSLGVLLYTLVYGAMPFDGSNFKRLVKQISEGEYFEPKEKSGASGLIRRLLTVDINHRATIRDICSDWWVNQGYDHSLLKVAGDMANLTPVRLDLLLALSSPSSQAADQSVKKQSIMTTHPDESKNALCNGYYSKSHPLRMPESVGSRMQTVTRADACSVSNAQVTKYTGNQQVFNEVDSAKDELAEYNKRQERLPSADEMKTAATKTPAADKNGSNTLIIVQDLIKGVISKVEQHININKMERLKNPATKETQGEMPGDCSLSQGMYERGGISDGAMESQDMTDTLQEAPKSKSLKTPLEGMTRNSILQQNSLTTATETEKLSQNFYPSNKNTVIETSKMGGISNGTNKAETNDFPEKTVHAQTNIFRERRKSIPSKSCDLQSRKSTVKLMEPDVVIPIFNVCCNIPKRSLDLLRPAPNDSKVKDAFGPTPNGFSEPDSKVIDCGMKSNDRRLPKSEGKDIVNSSSNTNMDIVPNNRRKDFTSSEIGSLVSTYLNAPFQPARATAESMYVKAGTDTKEIQSQAEAPKLPPRKKFLTKISKQEQSKEKVISVQSKPGDPEKVRISDKQEDKVSQEEPRMPRENEKEELQTMGKDSISAPLIDHKDNRTSAFSEDNVSLKENKTTSDAESSPKLSQRKSRRDTSKRSLSFNTKTGVNRESSHIMSERQNCSVNKGEYPEIVANVSAKEKNGSNTTSFKQNETVEELKDKTSLPQAQIDQGNKSTLKDIINSSVYGEEESLNSEPYSEMCTPEKRIETLDREVKTENDDLRETEEDKSLIHEGNEVRNMESSDFCDAKDRSGTAQGVVEEPKHSSRSAKPKKRSLSRTRAMSMEFESLAQMPVKIAGPPKKPPGKVEIPKTFDPTQTVTSPKVEMKEIIFIPTACVSENKEKIQKKIEKVKKSAIVMPPRRKSDAGVASRKKKYTRSKTDFILRNDDLTIYAEDENLAMDEIQRDTAYQGAILQNEETSSQDNMEGETVSSEMWYSAVSPDSELEECEQSFKGSEDRAECADNFDGFYNENDVTAAQNNQQHRHSVDTESGYWTPPEMTRGERAVNQTSMKMRDDKIPKKSDNSEKLMLQRAAFRNSKLRMKLSDEGLDMCSLSSSLESGIYSWRQEETNGKRISPDSESATKALSPSKCAGMAADGSYAPIVRSFKKMTFPPEHSSTSELSEHYSIVSEVEKNVSTEAVAFGRDNHTPQNLKPNRVDSKPIKPSDSQSSYGSNDISDDVFESWAEKEDVLTSKEKYEPSEDMADSSALNVTKNNGRNRKTRNWQRGGAWHTYSTDKESSDNDDDLDLMVDESHQVVYGTEGLWQFLKSVNQHLSDQLKTATQKMSSKSVCHRSKSQESKHSDDVMSQKRSVTRSLSREEKQRKEGTQLRHFVSEGKLANADSIDCFEDPYTLLNDTRYSSGYMASGSSLDDSVMLQKDFMSSADTFHNHSDDISAYGTLRRDKYFYSSSALNSPCMTRRKKSLQSLHSSGDLSNMNDNAESASDDVLSKHSAISEQNRKLSLYGTLRPKHLSQQGRAQSQILLSTDDGYQLMYNERLKKDPCSKTRYSSLGTLGSSANKASSEANVSMRESQLKDYEKILLTDLDEDLKRPLVSSVAHRNTPCTDTSYQPVSDKPTSRVKKIVSDKGMRRVSFSSDVKASKSDYHSSLRLNSLNKVREANEELLSSSNHKSNIYDDEQDSGSLLEALKTYGYRGIMSQKLQLSSDKFEPRLNYRLPTECFLASGLNTTGWDDFEYVPVESTLAYQQQIYSPVEPMEYFHCKTFTKGSQIKRNMGDYTDLPCDDEAKFKDIFRSHRLGERDPVSRRKPVHKFQDLNDIHLAHNDRYAGENRETKHTNSTRKKSFDSTAVVLSSERRNSDSGKIIQHERERDGEEIESSGSTDLSESRVSKQTENPIEILSEKIQALKSRCQRKSLDESRLKKELEDSGILLNEPQGCEKRICLDADSERLGSHENSVETLSTPENESSESVSDRIWRKSFYSRFNDIPTVSRRKKSPLFDSEYLSGHNSFRSAGKFNMDEEGGMEEPWLHTSMKRRNSYFSRSLPRQTMSRASSINSDAKVDHADCSSGFNKGGASESDTEYKSSFVSERRSLNQSNLEQSTSVVCDKSPIYPTKGEVENTNKMGKNGPNTPQNTNSSECTVLLQGSRDDVTEFPSSVTNKTNLIDASPNRITCERAEDFVIISEPSTNLLKGGDNIPETTPDFTDGGSTVSSGVVNISVPELENEASSPEDLASSSSAELNTPSEENLEKPKTEGNPTEAISAEVSDIQKRCDGLESDKQ